MIDLAAPPSTTSTDVEFSPRQTAGTAATVPAFASTSIAMQRPDSAMQFASSAPGRIRFRLKLVHEDDLWIATDQPTGIYGCGETVHQALSDFQHATREHLDVLERQPALSEPLQRQLSYLRARVA